MLYFSYSGSDWPTGTECNAIHVPNVSTELVCLTNLHDLNARTVPVLPWLIHARLVLYSYKHTSINWRLWMFTLCVGMCQKFYSLLNVFYSGPERTTGRFEVPTVNTAKSNLLLPEEIVVRTQINLQIWKFLLAPEKLLLNSWEVPFCG